METTTTIDQAPAYTATDFDLSARAVLVRLTITQWSARKSDKNANREIANNHNSDETMGNYSKCLIAREALDDIKQIANEARAYHYEHTTPYLYDGIALLPACDSWEYQQDMRQYETRFYSAVNAFLANYDVFRADARRRLNGLFREEDYPTPYEIKRKFTFTVDVDVVPNTKHIALDLSREIADQIADRARAQQRKAIQIAQSTATQRLREAVARIVDSLPKFDPTATGAARGTFRDTLVTNMADICERLKTLNITDDPELEDLRQRCQRTLTAASPEELRTQTTTRQRVTNDAAAILAKIDAYAASTPTEGT